MGVVSSLPEPMSGRPITSSRVERVDSERSLIDETLLGTTESYSYDVHANASWKVLNIPHAFLVSKASTARGANDVSTLPC